LKRIIVAPLDWGLGHASRCIPIIRMLLARECHVMLAGNGASLQLLKNEFPLLETLELPGYDPRYPRNGSMVLKMVAQLPHFIKVIRNEHLLLEKFVKEYKIDVVISDNRYGCWSARAYSIFITHQSNILMPKRFGWLSPLVRMQNLKMIGRFDKCWIPEEKETALAGMLTSFGKTDHAIPYQYVGYLSRFRSTGQCIAEYDVAAILSGPEPQRTILENILSAQLQRSGIRYYLVRGIPGGNQSDNQSCDFMNASQLQRLLEKSAIVIARCGYSTIMDLAVLKKKAILIPTPGQTEQEYLASRLKSLKIVFTVAQKDFDLNFALQESKKYSGFVEMNVSDHLLHVAVDALLTK